MQKLPSKFLRKPSAAPSSVQRAKVLQLYKRCMVIGTREWQGPAKEKKYIVAEAKRLFRMNQDLETAEEVDLRINEAEARIELALHYKIPYPRAYTAWGKTGQQVVQAKEKTDIADPVYMVSYYHKKKKKNETINKDEHEK